MIDPARHRKKLDSLLGEHAHARKKVAEEAAALEKAKQHLADVVEARQLVQGVARVTQEAAHKQISSVVTRCLQAVFGEEDAYEFAVRFEEKRHKTEARLVFLRDGLEIDPTTAAGGGVVDVAALALRLSCLMLARPRKRRLLVLDEPLRFLSKDYRPRARELLLLLAREMGVQVIMVTHAEELACGKVVELT